MEMRKEYKRLVGKPERKRRLGRTRCRWEDNIRMTLREIHGTLWNGIHPAWGYGPVAGSCEHSNEPLGSIKDGETS
jgi:hypothetical protein